MELDTFKLVLSGGCKPRLFVYSVDYHSTALDISHVMKGGEFRRRIKERILQERRKVIGGKGEKEGEAEVMGNTYMCDGSPRLVSPRHIHSRIG